MGFKERLQPEDFHHFVPERFFFFDAGEVTLTDSYQVIAALDHWLDRWIHPVGIAFRLVSMDHSHRFLLIVVLESDLSLPMYSEIGNVIASQVVTALSHQHEITLELSPPRQLTRHQLYRLQVLNPQMIQFNYQHQVHPNKMVPFTILLAAQKAPSPGHA